MPKPSLKEPFQQLEHDMIETMRAGLHQWRPDLDYPLSTSDFQACVRGLLQMYEIKRRPIAVTMKEFVKVEKDDR